jgi:hypothetical protein
VGVKAIIEKDAILFKHSIASYDVCDFFHDFNDAVAAGEFNKIEYSIWKIFKKFALSCSPKSSINVEVKYERKWRNPDFIITLHDERDSFTVVYDDDSLGTFLCENLAIPIVEAYCIDHGIQCFDSDGFRLPIDTIMESVIQYFDNSKEILISSEYCLEDGPGEISYKYTDSDLLWTTASSTAGQIYCNDLNCSTTTLNETINSCLKEIDNLKLEMAFKEDKKIEINNTKEKNNMNSMFNFDFGPVSSSAVRMSMYGLAVKNKDGKYVSYNAASEEIFDVEILNFDGAKFLYKMPVAIKDIAVGDIVIHNHIPMFVISIPKDGKTLKVVDPVNGEKKEVMLTKSPFGFNFATKVVNFLAGAFDATNVSENNPFGNMWMLAALGNNKDISEFLPLMMMSNGGNMNPQMMLPLMMMSDSKSSTKDILPMMMFMNMNSCTCDCAGSKTGGAGSGT